MAKEATATKTDEGAQGSREVAQPKGPPAIVAFKENMDKRLGELKFALPPHMTPERFQRIALTALQRKPDLLKCTQASLWNACLLAAQDGLMPDGREGAIVPFGENAAGKKQADIATFMPMIGGLRKLARNSGDISDWLAFTVNAKDIFEVELGDSPKIIHKPYMGPEEPGEIVAAYSVAWLKDGTISRDVMTIRDILKIKAKSKAANGPWGDATFFPEMCKKTVARRHYKSLPHSSDLDDVIQRDDETFALDDRNEGQIADRQTRRLQSTAATFDQFGGQTIDHQPDEQTGGDDEASKAFETDQAGSGTQQTANDERRWPNGAVPKDAEEYEHYAETKIGDFTAGPDVSGWWKSKPENDLRLACGVKKDLFDALQAKASARYSELLRAGKK